MVEAEAQTILEAVLRLRPHLRTQYELYTSLQNKIAKMQSYFVTIPKDVLGIILGMIPAGPQSHAMIYGTKHDTATRASDQMRKQFSEFKEQFKIHRKERSGLLFAEIQNIKTAPNFPKDLDSETKCICVKRGFDGQIIFALSYFGMMRDAQKDYDINPNNTIFALRDASNNLWPTRKFIMPCGLLLFHYANEDQRKTVIFDSATACRVTVANRVCNLPEGTFVVDDFGNYLSILDVDIETYKFSEFSGYEMFLGLC